MSRSRQQDSVHFRFSHQFLSGKTPQAEGASVPVHTLTQAWAENGATVGSREASGGLKKEVHQPPPAYSICRLTVHNGSYVAGGNRIVSRTRKHDFGFFHSAWATDLWGTQKCQIKCQSISLISEILTIPV